MSDHHINWMAEDMTKAILQLVSAVERQDLRGVTFQITAQVPRYSKPPRHYRGKFFGAVEVYEEEV